MGVNGGRRKIQMPSPITKSSGWTLRREHFRTGDGAVVCTQSHINQAIFLTISLI